MNDKKYKDNPSFFYDDGISCGELCIQRASRDEDFYYIALFRRNSKNARMFVKERFNTISQAQNYLEMLADVKNLLTLEEAINQGKYKW